MLKEIVTKQWFCDLCGKQIEGYFLSPIWEVFRPDGTMDAGSADPQSGDIIGFEVCPDCAKNADRRITDLFRGKEEAETEIPENDENAPKNDAKAGKNDAKAKKRKKKSDLDDGKIAALRRAGWTVAKIADEMGVARGTISKHLKAMNATAFTDELKEDEDEDND